MGLFQKKLLPIVSPQYQLGHQDTLLVVGLGNIGKEYDTTRHNIGFALVEQFAKNEEFNPWVEKKDLKSILCAKIVNGKKVILCKPATMMNLSGEAVQAVQRFYKIAPSNTCVIYDELDLDMGTIRTQTKGTSAGHNGINSILEHIENAFWRIRIGIGPKNPAQMDTANFVLQNFSKDQQTQLTAIKNETINLLGEWLSNQASPDTRKI